VLNGIIREFCDLAPYLGLSPIMLRFKKDRMFLTHCMDRIKKYSIDPIYIKFIIRKK